MKPILNISYLALLLVVAPSPALADWLIEPVSKERAKELGLEIRSKANAPDQVSVELEIKTEGKATNLNPGKVNRVELQMKEGKTCLVSANLREDRSKPGRVVVSFAADRAQLDRITLRVWVGQGLGGDIHELRVKDFVDLH